MPGPRAENYFFGHGDHAAALVDAIGSEVMLFAHRSNSETS
ncbi:hypothetical protein X759_21755 [Mesorhizobium sp. LSHC420B00]|nr:hypothetical protein X759_21755 [Mesorhizobium sp. LSHC420B00]